MILDQIFSTNWRSLRTPKSSVSSFRFAVFFDRRYRARRKEREKEKKGTSPLVISGSTIQEPVESFPRLGKTDEYESADGRLFNYKPSSTGVSNFPRRLLSIFEMTEDK